MTDARDDGDDRLRQAFATLAEIDQPTSDCPDPDRIWDAAQGRGTPAATAQIVDHLVGCGVCAEAWRLAVALPPEADTAATAVERALPRAPSNGVVLVEPVRPRRRAPWVRYAVGGGGALAMAAVIVLLVRARGAERPTTVASLDELVVLPGDQPHRAGSHAVGDVLRVRATVPAGWHAELRIYRDGRELLTRCPAPSGPTAGCERRGDRIAAEVTLPRIGTYRAVLVASPSPLPPPTDTLDRDSATATEAGATVHASDEVPVL